MARRRQAYSKAVVAACLVLVVAFTAVCMAFLWNGVELNDVLVASFFACFGIEFGSLAFVTRGKYRWVSGETVGHAEKEEEDGQE